MFFSTYLRICVHQKDIYFSELINDFDELETNYAMYMNHDGNNFRFFCAVLTVSLWLHITQY